MLVTGAQTPPQTDVERELNEVVAALSELGQHVQITVEPHLTPQKLQLLLRDGFHVWHFVGHGGFAKDGATGRLLFEDATGDTEAVSAIQLGILLNRSGLRLIVLDACHGAQARDRPIPQHCAGAHSRADPGGGGDAVYGARGGHARLCRPSSTARWPRASRSMPV